MQTSSLVHQAVALTVHVLVQGEGVGRSRQWQIHSCISLPWLQLKKCKRLFQSWTGTLDTILLAPLSGIASFPFPSPVRTVLPHMGQALPPRTFGSHHPAPPGCDRPAPQLGFQTRLHTQDIQRLAERGLQLRY